MLVFPDRLLDGAQKTIKRTPVARFCRASWKPVYDVRFNSNGAAGYEQPVGLSAYIMQ